MRDDVVVVDRGKVWLKYQLMSDKEKEIRDKYKRLAAEYAKVCFLWKDFKIRW